MYVNADPFRKIFAADLPAEKTALMAAGQRPLAVATFTDASGPPAWKTIPSWALVATQDNTIGTANTRFMAQRAAPPHTVEIDASHAVLVSHPRLSSTSFTRPSAASSHPLTRKRPTRKSRPFLPDSPERSRVAMLPKEEAPGLQLRQAVRSRYFQ